MPKQNVSILAFNRGIISPLALARLDVDRIPFSAEIQRNWMPRLLGSQMLRPGFGYTGGIYLNHKPIHIPFIFAQDDTAIIEVTDQAIRVKVNEIPITRGSVSSAVTNGTFNTDLSGWTDNDEVGGASTWAPGGYMQLLGDATQAARRTQEITVAAGDQNDEHALRIIINRGPVVLKVGSASGTDNYITETTLGTGTHSLAFTPTGNFFIDFSSRLDRIVLVDSVAVEASGTMVLPSPYLEADLGFIRWYQSADVIFVGCKGYQPRRIERRGVRSWSIVLYQPEDGPVRIQNLTNITITPSALSGNITLIASKNLFKSTQVGGLYKISSIGQTVVGSLFAENSFTSYIKVSGVESARQFSVDTSGVFVATLTLQRSFNEGVSWVDNETYTGTGVSNYQDTLDNQVVWYRVGIKTGNYTSGTASILISYSQGSIIGYARITAFTSPVLVSCEVLKLLGSTTPTPNWAEGEWSDYRGWPSGLDLCEGRLGLAGKSRFIATISDTLDSFDDEIEGDSGLISRSLGAGPIDDVNWVVSLYRVFIGTISAEKSIKTTSFEEPITPTNFKIVEPSNYGSANVNPAKLDKKVLFIEASGTRLYEISHDSQSLDYDSKDLTELCPEIGESGLTRIAVQRQPDTRIHCRRNGGLTGVLCYDPVENLKGWVEVETAGEVEDIFTMPGAGETLVYYSIKRTINGSTVRYLEKWAKESECQGGTLNKQADSFIVYSGVATTTITGLSHLEGEEVIVWADGIDYSPGIDGDQITYTVTSGTIILATPVSNAVVGLPYKARYKSTKLAYAAGLGAPLNQKKEVNDLGVILHNTHYQGLQYGADFDNLFNLPTSDDGKTTPSNTVWSSYDKDMFPFESTWDTDARICLQAHAPRPCTILAMTFGITTNDEG